MKITNLNIKTIKKVFKKGVALTVLTTSLLSLTSCSSGFKKVQKEFDKYNVTVNNDDHVGLVQKEDQEFSFSLAECGNYQTQLSKKAKKILEDDTLPTGIIISSCATSLAQIYKDVDYVKRIIKTYNVDCPIILNTDTLFVMEKNNLDSIRLVISEFVKKLESNNCFVCVKGTKQNIEQLQLDVNCILELDNTITASDLSNYDAFMLDDYLYTNAIDYYQIIKDNKLNRKKSFVKDYVHVVEAGETLSSISYKYGLSINNICEYNNIDVNDNILIGQEIAMPNLYNSDQLPNVQLAHKDASWMKKAQDIKDNYYLGIDVSEWQGNIDWSTVSEKVQFAIIRSGYGVTKDLYYDQNMQGCINNNLVCGVYHFSKAKNLKELNKELEILIANLDKYKNITLPVYIDFEKDDSDSHDKRIDWLINGTDKQKKKMNNIIRTFCQTMEELGYATGIYIHKDNIPYLDEDIKANYTIWASGGQYYDEKMNFQHMALDYAITDSTTMIQMSKNGDAKSIGITENSAVDLNAANRSFIDNLIKKFNLKHKQKIKKLD